MDERHVTPSGITVEFRQHDWIPGFAAYLHEEGKPFPNGQAFCAINLGDFLGAHVAHGETPAALAESLADTMVHEVIHVIEAWAGTEFSEARVEGLIAKYRGHPSQYGDEAADAGMDFGQALYLAKTEGRRIRRRNGWTPDEYVKFRDGGLWHLSRGRSLIFDGGSCPCPARSMSTKDILAEDWEVVDG